jgi:hypothetical protein
MKKIVVLIMALLTQGCASMLQTEDFSMDTGKGILSFQTRGCSLIEGKFTDRTGRGNRSPHYTFISVDAKGNTLDQFDASCNAVAGNGTSNCDIDGTATFAYYGGIACPDLKKFKVFQ